MKTQAEEHQKKQTIIPPVLMTDESIIVLVTRALEEGTHEGIVLHIYDTSEGFRVGEKITIETQFFHVWEGTLKISNH